MLQAPAPPPAAPAASKAPTLLSSSLGLQVLAVEEVARNLLLLLDFRSIDGLLASIQRDEALSGYLLDAALWGELLTKSFAARIPSELRFIAVPHKERSWDWTNAERTCAELREFLRSGDELAHFDRTVTVIRGDIGYIRDIDGTPVDGLGFPTNSHLTNHYIGAAAAIFQRAGKELSTYVSDPLFSGRRTTGEAVVTPAFQAGVSKLIHCVGPRISQPDCYQLLENTYESLVNAILREDLKCVAIASISTGNMGVPAKEGAQVAMRLIQKFIRSSGWDGALGIVCYEDAIFNAFQTEKKNVLEKFNAQPPLPANEEYISPWMRRQVAGQ
ncbi:Macro domain-containing protein [Globisporangium polare]